MWITSKLSSPLLLKSCAILYSACACCALPLIRRSATLAEHSARLASLLLWDNFRSLLAASTCSSCKPYAVQASLSLPKAVRGARSALSSAGVVQLRILTGATGPPNIRIRIRKAQILSNDAGLQSGHRPIFVAQVVLVSCWSMRLWLSACCHRLWRCAISAIQVGPKDFLA